MIHAEPAEARVASPAPGRLAGIALALALATLTLFGSALPSTFLNLDDDQYVTKNPHVAAGLTPEGLAWAFTTFTASHWHPVTWLSHMLDVQMFGLDAGKHHAVALLLHATNVVLLFLLLAGMTHAPWPSALAAGLFAFHPLHVESFAWIAERKDVLSTAFWLATTLAWLRYLRVRTTSSYVVVLAAYGLGLLSKPMLVTLPFTLLILDFWPLNRFAAPGGGVGTTGARLVLEKGPLFAMAGLSSVVTVVASHSGPGMQSLERFPLPGRLANALHSYAAYLGKTIWPSRLAVFYPYPDTTFLAWPTVVWALVLAGVTVSVLLAWRRAPYAVFGWLWYVGTLVPVLGLVQSGGQSMADRYMYVPSIGLFVAVSWGLAAIAARSERGRALIVAAACVWLVALAGVARAQLRHWSDSQALFEHAIAVTSDNVLAKEKLGNTLAARGQGSDAAAQYAEVLRADPHYWEAHYNLALELARKGQNEEAIEHMRRAIETNPNFAAAHNNLGGMLAAVGRTEEGLDELRTAIRLDPVDGSSRYNAGNLLARLGRDAEAVAMYEEALSRMPSNADALDSLGLALTRLERWPEAIERFEQELRLRPGSADAHESLGYSLARAGRMREALREFEEAARLDPRNGEAIENARKARAALGEASAR